MQSNLIENDFNLRARLLGDLSELKREAFSNLLNSINRLVQTFGIVAGFGFTAINYVQNVNIFLIGEFLIFTAMFYAVYKVHSIHEQENLWIDIFAKKIDKAGEILKDASLSEGEKHQCFKREILNDEESQTYKSPFHTIVTLGIIGILLVLLAFVDLSCFSDFLLPHSKY